jgi:Raf kinase inhibitor-like YbhB/YbcL family protein
MKITSQAFNEGGQIPDKYTMYGENRIPPLDIEGVPERARSLALIVDDPDAPSGTFNHWLLFNLDPKSSHIKEDCVPVMAKWNMEARARLPASIGTSSKPTRWIRCCHSAVAPNARNWSAR